MVTIKDQLLQTDIVLTIYKDFDKLENIFFVLVELRLFTHVKSNQSYLYYLMVFQRQNSEI